MSEIKLKELLDRELIPAGFERNKRGTPVYRRNRNGVIQELGLRKGRIGKDVAIYFTVPEVHTFYELSAICPLKNTFWWPELLTQEMADSLVRQLHQIVLRYFNSPAPGPEFQTPSKNHLEALMLESPPFIAFSDGLWRCRGDVIDIVDVESLVNGMFEYVYVSVWHRGLMSENEDVVPDNVSRLTSRTVGNHYIDAIPNSSLFYVGPGSETAECMQASIVATIAAYFEDIKTLEDVKAAVRPEFKQYLNSL